MSRWKTDSLLQKEKFLWCLHFTLKFSSSFSLSNLKNNSLPSFHTNNMYSFYGKLSRKNCRSSNMPSRTDIIYFHNRMSTKTASSFKIQFQERTKSQQHLEMCDDEDKKKLTWERKNFFPGVFLRGPLLLTVPLPTSYRHSVYLSSACADPFIYLNNNIDKNEVTFSKKRQHKSKTNHQTWTKYTISQSTGVCGCSFHSYIEIRTKYDPLISL